MTIKLTCGDGVVLRLQQEHFEKGIFNNPDIAAARSYTLQCKAPSEIVNYVLDAADGDFENVTITQTNFEELQNLCKELGFQGLDKQLRAFTGETVSDSVDLKEFLQLKERVKRQDKRLTEIEHQLSEVLSWKRKTESEMPKSVSSELESLEKKVEEVARVCEERNIEVSKKTEQLLRECAKQSDLEELAPGLAQLKESEKKVAPKPQPARPIDSPMLRRVGEFVYKSGLLSKKKLFDGIIAHLTRKCDDNVHDKGIVNVTASSAIGGNPPKNAVDPDQSRKFWSENEPNSWICYDFKERRVIPTSYSIRSSFWVSPKSWVIEVSNDGASWTEVDRRDNNNDLSDGRETANFKISQIPSEGVRFFRLRQTGENHQGHDVLELSSLEVFGTLFEK